MKGKRWLKIGLLLALPIGLGLLMVERRSWRPTVFRVTGKPFQIAFAPDGQTLAVASHTRSGDGAASVVETWSVSAPYALRQPTVYGHRIQSSPYTGAIAFSTNTSWLASASYARNHGVRLWDTRNGRLLRTIPKSGAGVGNLSFWPDDNTLTFLCDTGAIQQDIRTGGTPHHLKLQGVSVGDSVAYSPNGKTLACGVNGTGTQSGRVGGTVELRDTLTGDLLHKPIALEAWNLSNLSANYHVDALAFSPSGRHFAAAYTLTDDVSTFYGFGLWSVSGGKPLWLNSASTASPQLAFSPDGRWLANCDNMAVQIHDTTSNIIACTFLHDEPITSLAFSSDNLTLATSTISGSITMWRIR